MKLAISKIFSRLAMTSVKYGMAEVHISGQVGPLSDLIIQVYLFGHTRTLQHWRKESASVVQILQRNSRPSGKLMKLADMIECLREIRENRALVQSFRDIAGDTDYKDFIRERSHPPTLDQAMQVTDILVTDVLYSEKSKWDIANSMISVIVAWR